MASAPLKVHLQSLISVKSSPVSPLSRTLFPPSSVSTQNHSFSRISSRYPKPTLKSKTPFSIVRASTSSSSVAPPATKEEAITQAKKCLSATLEKPLNNPKLTAGRLKKLKQPRFRIEIPVNDDSPASMSQLAAAIFDGPFVRRRGGPPVEILIIWPSSVCTEVAVQALESQHIGHIDIASVIDSDNVKILNVHDVVVFMAPESSNLPAIKRVTDNLYPKAVVLLNPRWGFEEEKGFGGLSGFVGSFEVIYSFMGLEVRGVLSKRKGVIFKCVRDGVLSGERWNVLVEEDGELKVISSFKARPSIEEVETVLYNLMAMNSPITKSAKFLSNLVSNVTGKR